MQAAKAGSTGTAIREITVVPAAMPVEGPTAVVVMAVAEAGVVMAVAEAGVIAEAAIEAPAACQRHRRFRFILPALV
jgi:hypothetical protein